MENNKTQIVFIHGGDSFDTIQEFYEALRTWTYNPYKEERKRWRDAIMLATESTHDFIVPSMPNKQNADYIAWAIWFEKVIPFLRDGVILVGHSLGGGFLLRYLSENKLPITISQLHLIAGVIDDVDCPGVGEFGIAVTQWSGFISTIEEIHLWHSSDDEYVPLHHTERLASKCPQAITHYFTDRGHFLQPEFPELLLEIQK
ncbi:MAG: hypothetical protein V4606_04400 [Patescibacteria group bacterium]